MLGLTRVGVRSAKSSMRRHTVEAVSILPWHNAYSLKHVLPHSDGLTPSSDKTGYA